MAAHDDILLVVADLAVETTVGAIPFQQVGEGRGVRQIVDGDNLLDLGLGHGAQDVASNASKPLIPNFA